MSISLYLRDCCPVLYFFVFSSRRRHTRFKCDWSSDVCSSDLGRGFRGILYGVRVRSEIHLVRSGDGSRIPAKNHRWLYAHSTIRRMWAADGAQSREAPDVAFMRSEAVELIDAPVVS